MPSRSTRVRATWLALSLSFSVSVATSLGLSLCIAEDGHASVEVGHAEAPCRLEVERHHPGGAAFDQRELAHHPCEDRPLLQSASWVASPQKRLDAPAVVAVFPPAPAPRAALRVDGEVRSAPPSASTIGRQRRSIVLLV